MNLALYKKWVEETELNELNFKSIGCFDDVVFLSFHENDKKIVIFDSLIFSIPFLEREIPETLMEICYAANSNNTPFAANISNYLNHSKLVDMNILNNDKIIELHFKKRNIYNQVQNLYLILELIPRYTNIILCVKEKEKKIILDCKKKISFSENQTRQLLPKNEYLQPQTDYCHKEVQLGYPLVVDNIIFYKTNDYFSHLFDIAFSKKIESLKRKTINEIDNNIKRKTNKLKNQILELQSTEEIEYLSQCVELLRASFEKLKKGMVEIELTNYFIKLSDSSSNITKETFPKIIIPLNPLFSPQKNLDSFAKKYKKAQNRKKIIIEIISKTNQEIESLEFDMEKVNQENSFMELKDYQKRYPNKEERLLLLKKHRTFQKDRYNLLLTKQSQKKLFRVLPVNKDWEICIGRSSLENDLLTCKTAKLEDWWFHCRLFHGTHVVLRNFKKVTPPNDLINLCCRLAAHYSKAKNSINIPVDCTQIKFVYKPKGSAPGFVTYKNQKTFFVDPIDFREADSLVKNLFAKLDKT